MGEVSTIGLDIAKSVFQVHGVDVAGAVVIRKRVSRAKVLQYFGELPRCLVGVDACPSAHHWGLILATIKRSHSSTSSARMLPRHSRRIYRRSADHVVQRLLPAEVDHRPRETKGRS